MGIEGFDHPPTSVEDFAEKLEEVCEGDLIDSPGLTYVLHDPHGEDIVMGGLVMEDGQLVWNDELCSGFRTACTKQRGTFFLIF